MNAETLKAAGVDYDFGVKRFVGRANLYEKALAKFSKDTTFSRISDAYKLHDREQLLSSAHEFKGMCGNIGLTSLYEASDKIVQMLRSESYSSEELASAYNMLDERYNTIYTAVIASMEETI